MKNCFVVVFKKLFGTVFIFVFEKVKKLKKVFGIVFIFVFERMKREDDEKEERREEIFFQKHLLFVFSFLYFFPKQLEKFLKFFPKT